MSNETPLVGFHGYVDYEGIVQLGLIFHDAISDECQNSRRSNEISMIDGMDEYSQAKVVEGMMTNEERERAKMLEAILRYDLIRQSKEDKEVTVQKIKNLINLKPINITNDGLPVSEEDFDEIFDRLDEYYGDDGEGYFALSDDELDELYENMMEGNDIDME